MEAMADLFDKVNNFLGVQGPAELLMSPWFIGFLIVVLFYSLIKGMKYFSVITAGVLAGTAIYHYTFPEDTSDLKALIVFFLCMGALLLGLVYFAFIRE
ncbi:MAG: hypothetical protein LDL33_07800 [Desulfomonile sp.]|nr:hypothetical protein [Desulfomonile sp.]